MRTDGCLTLVRRQRRQRRNSAAVRSIKAVRVWIFLRGKYQQPDVANRLINRIKGDRFPEFFSVVASADDSGRPELATVDDGVTC
jgi:hypothetical protein